MCEITTAALVVSAIGVGVAAYGQYQAGQNADKAAQYQAQVARNNQIIAERAATDAEERGKLAEANHATQVSQLIGRQRAVLGGNGVLVDSGSALDITSDTAATGKYEELTIRSNADREALGFRTQGMNYNAEAGLDIARGANASSAGAFGAAGTLLSGAGSVASKWYQFNKQGAFSDNFSPTG